MKIILATHNKGKMKEFEKLLSPLGFDILSLSDIGFFEDIVEDGETFFENSLIKAKTIAELSDYPAIADDSGVTVDFLGGEPGIYTARFGGSELSADERNEYLLNLMKDVPEEKRGVQMVCVITLCFPNGKNIQAKGVVEGTLAKEQKGEMGFEYDRVFVYEGKTFAEYDIDFKNKISHRGKAMENFLIKLKEEGIIDVK